MDADSFSLSDVMIEPLDSKKHNRAAFSCGEVRIDNYLKKTAGSHSKDDFARTFVAILSDCTVVGYYSILAHSLNIKALPDEAIKRMPSWNEVPSIYLSMVGVHEALQGKELGRYLMADMFKRCINITSELGAHFIVLDALNDRAAAFYRRLGFVDIPSCPHRMLISMKKVRASFLI